MSTRLHTLPDLGPTHRGYTLHAETVQGRNRERFVIEALTALHAARAARALGQRRDRVLALARAAAARDALLDGRGYRALQHDRGEQGVADFIRNDVSNRLNDVRAGGAWWTVKDRHVTAYGDRPWWQSARNRRRLPDALVADLPPRGEHDPREADGCDDDDA